MHVFGVEATMIRDCLPLSGLPRYPREASCSILLQMYCFDVLCAPLSSSASLTQVRMIHQQTFCFHRFSRTKYRIHPYSLHLQQLQNIEHTEHNMQDIQNKQNIQNIWNIQNIQSISTERTEPRETVVKIVTLSTISLFMRDQQETLTRDSTDKTWTNRF